jgi:hypothetical protein
MWIEVEKTTRWPGWAFWPVVFGAMWLSLVGAIRFFYPVQGAKIVLCPLKRLIDLPCPTCGSTRSALSILSGDIVGAVAYNPLFFVVGMLLLAAVLVRLVFARRVRVHVGGLQRIGVWVVFAALLLGNWAYVIRMGR